MVWRILNGTPSSSRTGTSFGIASVEGRHSKREDWSFPNKLGSSRAACLVLLKAMPLGGLNFVIKKKI